MLLGNEKIRAAVEDLVRKPFYGSIILVGPPGIGKYLFAESLISELSLFDRLILDFEVEQRHIAQIRERLIPFMLRKAGGNIKVALIRGADEMSKEAQNALLKTLEEPTSKGLILLVVSRLSRLLTTVRSRSVIFRFQGIPREFSEEVLKRTGYQKEAVEAALQYFPHQPGLAQRLIKHHLSGRERPNSSLIDKERLKQILLLAIFDLRKKLLTSPNPKILSTLRECLRLYCDIDDYALNEKIQYANFINQQITTNRN